MYRCFCVRTSVSCVVVFLHLRSFLSFFFFFNDTATTEIYTLSLHDALPISNESSRKTPCPPAVCRRGPGAGRLNTRSEEHTSELQSRPHLVCRLLLEKKKKNKKTPLPLPKQLLSQSLPIHRPYIRATRLTRY